MPCGFEQSTDARSGAHSPLLLRRTALPAPRAPHRRALLASECAAGYAPSDASNATSACAACPVGTYAPGPTAVCALPGENPLCWADGGWPEGTFLAAYNTSSVAMLCTFRSDAPSLAAGASASCSFAESLYANCTLRTHYGAARTATVSDCAFDAAGQASLAGTSCTVLGQGGALCMHLAHAHFRRVRARVLTRKHARFRGVPAHAARTQRRPR
jgi:hypothetical protein